MMANNLILKWFFTVLEQGCRRAADSICLTALDNCQAKAIMASNNTPPASRQISAPRGVTRFWGAEK